MNTGINKGGANMDCSIIINGQHHNSSDGYFGKIQSQIDMEQWVADILMDTADDPSKAKIEWAMLDGNGIDGQSLLSSVLEIIRDSMMADQSWK
jgi:hypothetical protein